MEVAVTRWGNSLGVRVPKQLAQLVGLQEGRPVEIVADGNRLVMTPKRRRYTLAELLVDTTPADMHAAFVWGDDVGREVVD